MSEIPFVNRLGDEIEQAAAARIASRRRRIRRRVVVGAIGFAVAATGVAAASGVFSSATPEQLATSGIGCYDRADLQHANVSVLSTGAASPVETCRRVMRTEGPLVACGGPAVMVFPGGPGTCEKLGLQPLPAEYDAARKRVNRLARRIEAIEASVDCWDPRDLARRVQTLLDGLPGWRGWRTRIPRSMAEGPCGTVSYAGGDGSRSIDGVVDVRTRTVTITLTAARSTLDLLDRVADLADASIERCYDRAGAEALARERLAASGRTVTFRVEHLDGGTVERFQDRIDEGCTVIVGFGSAADGYGIEVALRH
jgi:hypothetical protein